MVHTRGNSNCRRQGRSNHLDEEESMARVGWERSAVNAVLKTVYVFEFVVIVLEFLNFGTSQVRSKVPLCTDEFDFRCEADSPAYGPAL